MKNRIRSIFAATTILLASACGGGEEGRGVDVTISGEALAVSGFPFPSGGEVVIADGWEIRFSHVLVTVANITLSENPDKVPTDASQTDAAVAVAEGPWVVDLHEKAAIPITTLDSQTANGDAAFEADRRYAFGYELVAASAGATRLNLDGDAEAAYAEMVDKGHALQLVGTATFKGSSCASSDPDYDFAKLPTEVKFRLGFATPTRYINCQNQDNQGEPFDGEEYPRGVAIPTNAAGRAQITLHLDHPFYADVEHEPALHFDQMAAQLVGRPEGTELTIDDLAGVDPTAFTDGEGAALPWRVCTGGDLPATQQMAFSTGAVPVNPSAPPDQALRDYRDFVHYVQSAMGHLNGGEGLCYVKRGYPSPP